MEDLKSILAKKKEELEELKRSRPKATCVNVNSYPHAVVHELKVEELEEEIKELEQKVMK